MELHDSSLSIYRDSESPNNARRKVGRLWGYLGNGGLPSLHVNKHRTHGTPLQPGDHQVTACVVVMIAGGDGDI